MSNLGTYFLLNGEQIGSSDELLPIPLRTGMKITIHGRPGETFEVTDWDFHYGHSDENAGLKIHLRDTVKIAGAK